MSLGRSITMGVLAFALSSTSALCYAQSGQPSAAGTAAAANAGQAQAAEDAAAGAEIVVTGIRESLAESINVKRNSDQIVDSIIAEDIGKLPDRNVAESLSRVSGVQVEQGIDEAKDISIRGLRQNRLEFNGRSLISPYGRGADGPDEGAYNVMTLIPSELVARLDVTKLPAASHIEGSLGGTVNILTRRPSPSRPFFVGGSIEGVYKDKADKLSGRATGLIAASLFEDTLGVSLGVNYQKLKIRNDSTDSFTGWRPFDSRFNNNPERINFDPNGDGSPIYWYNDIRYQVLEEDREKLGVTAGLNWEPSTRFNAYADFLYARADTTRDRTWLSIPLSPTGSSYTDVTISENENLIAGTIRATLQGNGEVIKLPTDIYSGAVGGSWVATDRLTIAAEVAYSEAKQDYTQAYLRADTRTTPLISFDFRGTDAPSISFPGNLDLTNPANFGFRTSFDNLFLYRSKEKSARIDATYEIEGDFLRSIQAGFRYSRVDSDREVYRDQSIFNIATTPVTNFPGNWRLVSYPDLLEGASGSFPRSFVVAVPLNGTSEYVCKAIAPTCNPQLYDPTSSYRLEEPTYAAYGQVNFRSALWDLPFTGNVGLRYVRNGVDAYGWAGSRSDLDKVIPNNVKLRYDDWLPSAALRFELDRRTLLRFGAARVMSRAETAALTPSFSVVETAGSATVGNPALDPFRVNQLDASFEFYPSRGAIYSVALFYKDVESFLYQRMFSEAIPGFIPDPSTSPDGLFRITRTVNGRGGEIKGLEAQATQPFTFLPGVLSGFGVNGTFSYIESKTGILDERTDGDLPIPGLSKYNVNLAGFYEAGPCQARGAGDWGRKNVYGVGTGGSGIFFRPFQSLSASVRYDLTEAYQIYFEASNLTDEPVRRFGGFEEATQTYRLGGRTFTAGLRFRFGQ